MRQNFDDNLMPTMTFLSHVEDYGVHGARGTPPNPPCHVTIVSVIYFVFVGLSIEPKFFSGSSRKEGGMRVEQKRAHRCWKN